MRGWTRRPQPWGAAPRGQRCDAPALAITTVLAGILAAALTGCSLFSYGRPVVVPPPGSGDSSTAVGATVRCNPSKWPVGLDVTGFALTGTVGTLGALTTAVIFSAIGGSEPDVEPATVVVWLLPATAYLASAIYGGRRVSQCRRALVASARAKLRGEPLRIEGVPHETPTSPVGPPPGPPQSVAPPPRPPR